MSTIPHPSTRVVMMPICKKKITNFHNLQTVNFNLFSFFSPSKKMSGAITEVHRRIMQHLMGKGYAEKGELGKLFTELKLEHKEHWASRGTSLADLVNELNQALSTNQLHMRIGTIKHPIKNLTFWGLINEVDKKEDMVNRMATRYSVQELEFFKSIVRYYQLTQIMCVLSHRGCSLPKSLEGKNKGLPSLRQQRTKICRVYLMQSV